MLLESPTKKENRQISIERKRSSPDEIKVLIDSVLLAIKMNTSMLSVQKITKHTAKYVSIPNSWRSKNYAFEFIEIINGMVQDNVMADISLATYHTLTVDESTDISVNKYLILCFKYQLANSNVTVGSMRCYVNSNSC